MKQQVECPTCGAVRCYDHCNFCGKSIYWKRDPYDEKSKMYEKGTEIEHFGCMKKGTGKWLRVNEEPNEYKLNKHVTIYRLGKDSGIWGCTNCKRKDDLWHMKKHHELDGFPCKQKWWKLESNEAENKPVINIGNFRLDEFIGAVQ